MCRIVRVNGTEAERLDVVHDTLVEPRGTHPAPLREWVMIDEEVADGSCPMDPFGRSVLGVAPGDSVVVKTLITLRVAAGFAG